MINFADLFSGCGGLSYGFHKKNDFSSCLAVDSWAAAGKTYKKNFKSNNFIELDLYDENSHKVIINNIRGKIDLVIGGPPCQGFSTLGKRKYNCKKCTLVDAFIDISIGSCADIILMENVPGFKSKKHII